MRGRVGRIGEQVAAIVVAGLVLAALAKAAGLAAIASVTWPRLLLIDSVVLVAGFGLALASLAGFRAPQTWWSLEAWRRLRHEARERRERDRNFERLLKAGHRRAPADRRQAPSEPVPPAPPTARGKADVPGDDA